MDDIRKQILRVHDSRVHKVTNSLGVYDAYKWIRRNKWLNIGQPLKEKEFYNIIRGVNDLLADNISNGIEVVFPHRMGKLELRKTIAVIKTDSNGVLKTNLPVDWDKTLKLWCTDKEAYDNKILVKLEEREIFRVFYNRFNCNYRNSSFYEFNINRNIKKRLKQNIKEGILDAYTLY